MCHSSLAQDNIERAGHFHCRSGRDDQLRGADRIIGVQLHRPLLRVIVVRRHELDLSSWALKHNRNESSTTRSPRASGAAMASPLRNTATHLWWKLLSQSSCGHLPPPGVSQAMSRSFVAASDRLALEEPAAAEHRMLLAQGGHFAGESPADRHSCRPTTSPSRTIRSPGSRRCCCRAGCGRSRRRARSSACPG